MKIITAKELFELKAEPVTWVCKPWLALEAITELDGAPKSAGKTTFMLAMSKAILNGEEFLGEPNEKERIVYLTEESATTFRIALERSGINDCPNFHVLFWKETHTARDDERLGTAWEQIIDRALKCAMQVGAKLLVVDTFAQFAKLTGDRENSAGDVLKAMRPLQKARDLGLAVMLIRHERKSGGGVGESGRGSSALSGVVDVILQLKRAEGRCSDKQRRLEAISRFDETPGELMIELSEGRYRVVGNSGGVAVPNAADGLLAILPGTEDLAVTLSDLVELSKAPRTTVQSAIAVLEGQGQVKQRGIGKKGDPVRYYRNAAGTPTP